MTPPLCFLGDNCILQNRLLVKGGQWLGWAWKVHLLHHPTNFNFGVTSDDKLGLVILIR
jgi:hypothetical protein